MRIGVHVGEVIVEPERLTGDAVNIAARIESFAAPGAVTMSDPAYEQVRNRSDVAVVSLGRFKLKNVGRPFELYGVSADGLVVPEPGALEGKGERFASLPSNLPESHGPLIGRGDDLESSPPSYDLVMNHKRKGPKQSRAGCMLCKPSKNSHNRTADRMKARRQWQWRRLEDRT